jgi:exosortase
MLFVIAGIIIYFFGFSVLKEMLFPLFLLVFMIPIPSQIYSSLTIPLQLFVSKCSAWIAGLFGIPIHREGNIIHIPDQVLQVVQACSGLRSMISLLTLSAVFGYFTLKSNLLRTILFFIAVPVSIVVNIVRVLIMIIEEHYFKYGLTEGGGHTLFGLAIFALALILIALCKGVLSKWDTSIQKKS